MGPALPDYRIEDLISASAFKAFVREAHPSKWSLTNPIACMKAYIVVGPTKIQPRFLRSLDKAIDFSEVVALLMVWRVICCGRLSDAGRNTDQAANFYTAALNHCVVPSFKNGIDSKFRVVLAEVAKTSTQFADQIPAVHLSYCSLGSSRIGIPAG